MEYSNGRVEETQKEESGGKAVEEVVKELFQELKSEVLEVEEAVLGGKESNSHDEELGSVSDPVEVVSSDMNQGVEIPVEDDLGYTNVVEQKAEEIKDKIIEFVSEGPVEKKGVEETEVRALDSSVAETSKFTDKGESEKKDDDSMNPPAESAEDVDKDEIITETSRDSPITSIADRASWRNCCGLFEVLQRNK